MERKELSPFDVFSWRGLVKKFFEFFRNYFKFHGFWIWYLTSMIDPRSIQLLSYASL